MIHSIIYFAAISQIQNHSRCHNASSHK